MSCLLGLRCSSLEIWVAPDTSVTTEAIWAWYLPRDRGPGEGRSEYSPQAWHWAIEGSRRPCSGPSGRHWRTGERRGRARWERHRPRCRRGAPACWELPPCESGRPWRRCGCCRAAGGPRAVVMLSSTGDERSGPGVGTEFWPTLCRGEGELPGCWTRKVEQRWKEGSEGHQCCSSWCKRVKCQSHGLRDWCAAIGEAQGTAAAAAGAQRAAAAIALLLVGDPCS